MQRFWIEERQVYSVITEDKDKGLLVMCAPGTQRWLPWEEAERLHKENPENGLLDIG